MASKTMTASDALFSGFWKQNPILRLLLGMCPTLAVTTSVGAALTMGGSVIFVLVCSNIIVSLMRNLMKPHLRILMYTLTIATFVTIADLILKAFLPEMSENLGPFIPLIIVNCVIIGRAEACASKNNLFISFLDAIGMGLGFTITLAVLAAIREVLATGQILGCDILNNFQWFTPMVAMILPVGAFVTLGLMIGLVNVISNKSN